MTGGRVSVARKGSDSGRRPRRPPSGGGARNLRGRAPGRIYAIKPEHLALIAELDRLFPKRAPVIDFGRIEPGTESVEVVALQLLEAMRSGLEQPLFVCFCHVNAERLLDAIDELLERGAYPLSRDEVLAEIYSRLYRFLRDRGRGDASSGARAGRWEEIGGRRTVFGALVDAAEELVREQVAFLAACELPLPGLAVPELDPGDDLLAQAQALLQERNLRIPGKTAAHWVAHALLRIADEERRILYLHERRGFDLRRIAAATGVSPFDAGVRLRRARESLRDRLLSIAVAFRPDPIPAREATVPDPRASLDSGLGSLLSLPERRESRTGSPSSEEGGDDEA